MPFGAEVKWDVIRQMPQYEIEDVETALSISHLLLIFIGVFTLLLVLSCGPLLPVWMFINSMQLIVHVPLIRAKLPGNSHFFLLDHLNILRMHFFRFNLWL